MNFDGHHTRGETPSAPDILANDRDTAVQTAARRIEEHLVAMRRDNHAHPASDRDR